MIIIRKRGIGNLYSKRNYVNGEEDGYWEQYWTNGVLMRKGNFKNGKQEGEWVFYYWDNGKLSTKANYINGKEIGKWEIILNKIYIFFKK